LIKGFHRNTEASFSQLVGDVERALVSRPGIIATESAAKSNNSFFLIHKQLRFTGSIGKGYRILVFIEITILANEAPLPEIVA
jgi:hypothetical protein